MQISIKVSMNEMPNNFNHLLLGKHFNYTFVGHSIGYNII